jgi:hypothetical protein
MPNPSELYYLPLAIPLKCTWYTYMHLQSHPFLSTAVEYVEAFVISGFDPRCNVFFVLLERYALLVVNDISGQPVEMEPIGCTETSLRNVP